MEMPALHNGVPTSADRPGTSSPVDRLPSAYFPFPLSVSDGPFFPPTAEAFAQAAAAAAVGRSVAGRETPSLGPRTTESPAAEERTGHGAGSYSPGVDEEEEEEDAVSGLSCAESDGTASPGPSPGDPADPASCRPPAGDVEMIAS